MATTKVPGQQLLGTYPVTRDNNGSTVNEANAKILTGWGWIQNAGAATATLSEAVTFVSAFTNVPIVLITYGGDAGNVPAVLGTGGNSVQGHVLAKVYGVTTTGFNAYIGSEGSNWSTSDTVYYHWIAIGI